MDEETLITAMHFVGGFAVKPSPRRGEARRKWGHLPMVETRFIASIRDAASVRTGLPHMVLDAMNRVSTIAPRQVQVVLCIFFAALR